ncbi:hypothetical protein PHYBLDRAFT_138711 [Phycomyces blakesleeanus NRRL 1555(-)]|uniref:Uncharacterized protein n=1 Tax=Phycomyces blakesleeanus (strain ATCC 8743b / DSM 1359 / FGSC 10004 / NBRC 33097 / NRRL 1555) TaxID=763407 RepID=A0A167R9K8_PHYB8|nr:hypothetical protein PHYBLDRAFT_138711 [Phycomyces blakesleeanus NRRL 1555(-)]OAD81169.1 hypothetical protein PHYBLDRAFT_138711 [Phycomyces blakesleeanus NRRL 1555(-)]|eukprot:XP_018299209.1 hypothetical protein PHYBLDRAFT_138711 [Phycomyces blakesleeanus NRRL 1555(-)]
MPHIFDNGSWVNNNRQHEYPGSEIAECIKRNDDTAFRHLFLGGLRDFADNNDTNNVTTLKDNSFAAFVIKNSIGMTHSIGLISGLILLFFGPLLAQVRR